MNEPPTAYGRTRDRGPTVSYAEIERTARDLMAKGERPTVEGVRKALGRGSPNHLAPSLKRFWKDQAALNAGDPIALTRLPPELADAAVAQWEQALRLAQQTATYEDNAARASLEQLRRDTEVRAHSVKLREKEWDLAARIRERALAETREHVNVLLKELALGSAELRARETRIADLEVQLEQLREQLATVIARAIVKPRARPRATRPPGRSALSLTRRPVLPSKTRRGKSSVANRKRAKPTSQSARKPTSPSRSRSTRHR
jgi:Plasmid replication region DNA-binding N-term